MGKLRIAPGGGADLDVITATAADVVAPKVIVDKDGEPVVGTMPIASTGTYWNRDLTVGLEADNFYSFQPYGKYELYDSRGSLHRIPIDRLRNAIGAIASKIANNQVIAGITGTYKGRGNALHGDVINGRTFSTGSLDNATGNLPDYRTTATYISNRRLANGRVEFAVARGAHAGSWNYPEYMSYEEMRSLIGLNSPDMLRKGVWMLGWTGTFQGYVDSPLYLYNKGTWSNLQTIGSTFVSGYTFKEYPTSIMASSWSGPNYENDLSIRLNQTVNLSQYKYLKIRMNLRNGNKDYPEIYTVGVSTSPNLKNLDALQLKTSTTSYPKDGVILTVDINNAGGDYYIYVGGRAQNTTCEAQVLEIFLSTV